MQRSVVRYLLGRILLVEAILLILPLLVSLLYQEPLSQQLSYLSVIALVALIGFTFSWKQPPNYKIHARDGVISVALSWILMSFFGALPLVISGEIPHLVDAFFEISSGFTTTGSSILQDLSVLHHSSLFWRSFTHLIGGMGVLVFTLAILPNSGSDSVQLMRAEVPGPIFGKLVSRLSQTAQILYGIYLLMTAILVFILCLVKVPFFDALLLAFGTAGTGGFSVNNGGFQIYEYPHLVEWIIGFGMLLFGINFNLYFLIFIGHIKDVFKDEELKYYLGIITSAVILIVVNLYHMQVPLTGAIRSVFFTVASLITTTGFSTVDFGQWPLFSQTLLLLLMFIGGCAGSTAGGIKVSRIVMYFKVLVAEFKRAGQPRRVIVPKFSGKPITQQVETKVVNYLLVYIMIFIVILLSVSFEVNDFITAFSSVAATFNNIGPGLGQVGPIQNYSGYSDWNKILLSIGMLAGRLEIYPIILLFAPTTLMKFVKGNRK